MRNSGIVASMAMFAGALLAGCDGTGGPTAPASTEVATVTPPVLATLKLSDTHTLTFLDLGDGEVGITERLDPNKDANAPKLQGMRLGGLGAGDVYQKLAGERMDGATLGMLQALDKRAIERDRTTVITPEIQKEKAADSELNGGVRSGTIASKLSPSATQASATGTFETRTSAVACAEPSDVNFDADTAWWKSNFCGGLTDICVGQVGWADCGFWQNEKVFSATGLDQSFCSTADWLVRKKTYGRFPLFADSVVTVVHTTLQPRDISFTFSVVNISSIHAYYAKVQSNNQWNPVGFSCNSH